MVTYKETAISLTVLIKRPQIAYKAIFNYFTCLHVILYEKKNDINKLWSKQNVINQII